MLNLLPSFPWVTHCLRWPLAKTGQQKAGAPLQTVPAFVAGIGNCNITSLCRLPKLPQFKYSWLRSAAQRNLSNKGRATLTKISKIITKQCLPKSSQAECCRMRSAQKPSAAHSKAAKVQVSPEAAEVSANATVDVLAEP